MRIPWRFWRLSKWSLRFATVLCLAVWIFSLFWWTGFCGDYNQWFCLNGVLEIRHASQSRAPTPIIYPRWRRGPGAGDPDDVSSGWKFRRSDWAGQCYSANLAFYVLCGFERPSIEPWPYTEGDGIGRAVAVSGDTLVLGAESDEEIGVHAGAVYVYRRQGTEWRFQQRLLAPNGSAYDLFGATVAVDGDVILVGAPTQKYTNSAKPNPRPPVAHVFRFDGSKWIHEQEFKQTASVAEEFAHEVGVHGDVAVVASIQSKQGLFFTTVSNSINVFRFDFGRWDALPYPDGVNRDETLSTSIVHACERNIEDLDRQLDLNNQRGSALSSYLRGIAFESSAHSSGRGPMGDGGQYIDAALCEDRAVVSLGGPFFHSRKIRAYHYDGQNWKPRQTLIRKRNPPDWGGYDVAISEDTLVAGCPSAYGRDRTLGRANIYTLDGDQWKRTQRIRSADPEATIYRLPFWMPMTGLLLLAGACSWLERKGRFAGPEVCCDTCGVVEVTRHHPRCRPCILRQLKHRRVGSYLTVASGALVLVLNLTSVFCNVDWTFGAISRVRARDPSKSFYHDLMLFQIVDNQLVLSREYGTVAPRPGIKVRKKSQFTYRFDRPRVKFAASHYRRYYATSGSIPPFVSIPLWLLFLATGIPALFLCKRRGRVPDGLCVGCGYDLTKNTSGRCPECGLPID